MRNRTALQALDLLAQRYGTRPSALLHLTDEWAAYQLDLCALYVGVKEAAREGGRARAEGDDGAAEHVRYTDPAPLVSGTIRIEDYPNGLW